MLRTTPVRLFVLALLLLYVVVFRARAQEPEAFAGPAIGLTAASVQTSFTYTGNGQDLGSKSASSIGLSAAWGFALSDSWVVNAELSYTPDTLDLASQRSLNPRFNPPRVQTLTLKSKNDMGFSIAPGYRIGGQHLLFGKLSYHTMAVEAASSLSPVTLQQNIEVPGWGLGYACRLTPHLEVQGEYESLTYTSSSLKNASQELWRLGLKYRF
jgi:opacity protein-like surface antigen